MKIERFQILEIIQKPSSERTLDDEEILNTCKDTVQKISQRYKIKLGIFMQNIVQYLLIQMYVFNYNHFLLIILVIQFNNLVVCFDDLSICF